MFLGFVKIEGYDGLEDKFVGPQAWPNFTREWKDSIDAGLNVSEHQAKYGKCGKYRIYIYIQHVQYTTCGRS